MYSLYSGRNTKYSVILTFCKIETYMPKEFSFHFQVYQVSCVLIWIKNPRSSLHVLKSLSAMAMELGGKTTPRSLKTTIRCTQGHVTFLQTYIIILVISYISQVSRYLIFSILRWWTKWNLVLVKNFDVQSHTIWPIISVILAVTINYLATVTKNLISWNVNLNRICWKITKS